MCVENTIMMNKKKIEIHFLAFGTFITFALWLTGIMNGKLYIFSIFLIFIYTYVYFWHLLKFYKVKKWKKIQGDILKHKVNNFDVSDGSKRVVERYRPYYLYEYVVNGKQYKNDQLGILAKDFSEPKEFVKLVERKIQKNLKKSTVTIYYDPTQPENSILINEFSSGRMLLVYMYLFFAVTLFIRVILYIFLGM